MINEMPVPFPQADYVFNTPGPFSEADYVFRINLWRLSQYLDYIEEYVMQDFELRGLYRPCFVEDEVTHERGFLFRGNEPPSLQYHTHVIICLRGFLAVQQCKRDAEFSRQVKTEQDQHSVKTSANDNNQDDNVKQSSNNEMEMDKSSAELLSPTTKPTASASKRSSQRQHHKVDKATPRATRERKAKKHVPIDFDADMEEDKVEEQDSNEDTSEGQSQLKLVKVRTTKPLFPAFNPLETPSCKSNIYLRVE